MNENNSMESPLFNVMGKLLDVLIMSVLFWVCCIPIFTVGASISALYTNCLKMAEDKEGYAFQGFFQAFRSNFRRVTLPWLIMLAIGIGLGIDGYFCIFGTGFWSYALRWAFLVLLIAYMAVFTYVFPVASRCIVSTKRLFIMSYVMAFKELPWTILMIVISLALMIFGIFVYQPAFIIAPGVSAFLHSYIFKRIFEKYNLVAPERDEEEEEEGTESDREA